MYKVGTVARLKGVALRVLLRGGFMILLPVMSLGANVNLLWQASTDSGVAGYNVYYGNSSRSYITQIQAGANLSTVVPGLVDGTTYYFAVTAVDALGNESDYSNEISYTVGGASENLTISPILDMTLPAGQTTGPISFTVSDPNGLTGLSFSAVSSQTTLVPNANIAVSGSGADRTVNISPASGQSGITRITISVNDGTSTASTTFTLTIQGQAAGAAPTISSVANQTVTMNQATAAIPFTINDSDTAIGNLTLSAVSANTTLVPNAKIVLGGSGQNRTVKVTPATGQTGSAQITISVGDGTSTTTSAFTLTVQAPAAPTISSVANQSVTMNQATAAIPFTINDSDTAIGNLTLSAVSANTTLVPNAKIVLGGSGQNRTVKVTPATGQTGSAQITISVGDGTSTTTSAFTLTVQAQAAPTISSIANQSVSANQATAAIPFTINDTDTPVANLTLSAVSSNTGLVPNSKIVLGGSGQNRTVTVTPTSGQTGSAQITISVSDGTSSTSTAFTVAVQAQSATPVAPTISSIASQNGYMNQSTAAIPFTVNDTDTPVASLTLSAVSSDQTLVPNSSILLGGSGQNRTVTITPTSGQTGSAQITITVSDGSLSATTQFVLSVSQATAMLKTSLAKSTTYNSLFYESDAARIQSAGALKLTVSSSGKYSGSLQMAAGKYSFSGVFGALCQGTSTIIRKGASPLVINFNLKPSDSTNPISGTLSDGAWTAQIFGAPSVFSAKTNPAPYAGIYTMAVPGEDSSLGNGFGSVKVDGNGNVKFAGTLADGSKVTQSAPLSKDGLWPLFLPLYSGKGFIIGWVSFANRANDDLHGALNWIKLPDPAAHYYPGGLTLEGDAVGSKFVAGSALALNAGIAKLKFVVGGTGGGRVVSLTLSQSTGLFKGNMTDQTTGKPLLFQGALLQKPNTGFGFILDTSSSTPMMLTP